MSINKEIEKINLLIYTLKMHWVYEPERGQLLILKLRTGT